MHSRPIRYRGIPALTLLFLLLICFSDSRSQVRTDGTVGITPQSATAGTIQTMNLVYRPGSDRIETGGGIRFELPVAYSETEPYFWSKPQTEYRDAPGYVSASSSNGATVSLRTYGIAGGIIECVLEEGRLAPGDSISIVYRGIVQSLSWDVNVRYQVRRYAEDDWADGPDPPVIRIHPRKAHTLITTAPSDIQAGEPFSVAIVAIDRFGNRATGYRGTISLESSDSLAHLFRNGRSEGTNLTAEAYSFTETDAGMHVFDHVRFGTTGFQRIRARDTDRDLQLSAHYAWVSNEAPSYRRLFGDTHFHTGTGTRNRGFLALPEAGDINTLALKKFRALNSGGDHRGNFTDARSAYAYARDVVRLDFASSSEHDAFLFDSLAWASSQEISESFNEPGRFTTFFAYEWTSGFNHHIVLYKDRGQGVFDRDRFETLPALWEALDLQDASALTIPHVSWTFEDHSIWDHLNNTYRRIGEIYSLWNNRFLVQPDDIPQRFEAGPEDEWSYQRAWSGGHRIGLVGSTDNHLGRPGANNYTIYTHHTGGFAVALSRVNTREDLWDAFEGRRTYATTGTRIYLDFRADDQFMGSEFATARPPKLSVKVAGTNRLARVELLKYEEHGGYQTLRTETPDGDISTFDHTDLDFDSDALYYVRVTQVDEYPGRPWSHSTAEMAWSSPIWVRFGGIQIEDGGIIRGRQDRSEVALVFTGDEHGDGLVHVREVLDQEDVPASFFFTGNFYRNPEFADGIRGLVGDGHYLGAHSDRHLLYNSWEARDSMLVTEDEFRSDVLDNFKEMSRFGIGRDDARYFLPPYEWYNEQISEWARELGLTVVNYSPGTSSHADYTTPEMDHYISSHEIVEGILDYEKASPDEFGLNGFILLSHVGAAPERTDKFYRYLGPLIRALKQRGYRFVRIDTLLED